jgi:hypothetical protein
LPINITLLFLAPVAVGSEVTIVFFEEVKFFGGWEDAEPLVIDHKSGIAYGPSWVPLEASPEDLLAETLSAPGYRHHLLKPPLKARVLCCSVRSKGVGDYANLTTLLIIEPIVEDKEPYRG